MISIVLQIETVLIKWEQDRKNQRWPDGTYINNDYIQIKQFCKNDIKFKAYDTENS